MTDNLVIDNPGDTAISVPRQWEWNPQPDITLYELALALPLLFYQGWDAGRLIQDLPGIARRHFREVKH